MTSRSILIERREAVEIITLNAPERLNAIDSSMGAALDKAFVTAARDPAVRVVILTGAGRGFCAGASMDRLEELRSDGGQTLSTSSHLLDIPGNSPPELRSRYTAPMAIGKPVIAAVNGACAGAGLVMALACDIRLASTEAKFVASFARLGLVAEGALAFHLPRIVGAGMAADMLLTARSIASHEAIACGLVSHVFPSADFVEKAIDFALSMARWNSPRSMRTIKQQLQQAMESPVADVIAFSKAATAAAVLHPDLGEGLRAYRSRTSPTFDPIGDEQ